MSNELLEKWKKMGIRKDAPAASAARHEEKKVPAFHAPIPAPAPASTSTSAPMPKPVAQPRSNPHTTAPTQEYGVHKYIPGAVSKAPAVETKPVVAEKPRESKTDEMKRIMADRAAESQAPAPAAPAPVVRKTHTDEMKETMVTKAAAPAPRPVEQKRKTYMDEMNEIMKAKAAAAGGASQPMEQKRRTYMDEMNDIMKSKAGEKAAQPAKQDPKHKSATEEMQDIMRAKAEQPAPAAFPVSESQKKVHEYVKEVKPVQPVAIPTPAKSAAAAPADVVVKSIDEDEEMRKMRELLEANIRFNQGDTLEWKKKPEPVIEAAPAQPAAEAQALGTVPAPEQQAAASEPAKEEKQLPENCVPLAEEEKDSLPALAPAKQEEKPSEDPMERKTKIMNQGIMQMRKLFAAEQQ